MPSIQKRKVSVAEELATIEARLTKLETFPPSGMTLLTSYVSASGGTFTSASETYLSPARTPNFTLIRPVPVLLVGTITFGPNTAAAGNSFVRPAIYDNPVTKQWIAGPWCENIFTISAGTLQQFVPGTSVAVGTLPAGTYNAQWNGETTPGNSTFSQVALYVFQLAG